jgi:hypothetical protein
MDGLWAFERVTPISQNRAWNAGQAGGERAKSLFFLAMV